MSLLSVLLVSLLLLFVALVSEPGLALAAALSPVPALLLLAVPLTSLSSVLALLLTVLLPLLLASPLLLVSLVALLFHLLGPLPSLLASLTVFPWLPALPVVALVPLLFPASIRVRIVLAHGSRFVGCARRSVPADAAADVAGLSRWWLAVRPSHALRPGVRTSVDTEPNRPDAGGGVGTTFGGQCERSIDSRKAIVATPDRRRENR
ncbi:hypothetical protein HUG10_18845 (plasmid) [Halorarum halophilum]|uniref:Uncharacterized protein n=1 Tax=Halorarum halophilum TaxID=2743090 RepID=A0A7D5GNZ6_9EURY|nr:hypothetical protein [Halobaculum halophilum]QLG29667.1 hypothetical protein HUG10_18845 [Halobaculum halophilum]